MSTYDINDDDDEMPEEEVWKRFLERYYVEFEVDPAAKAYEEKINKERAPFYDAQRRYLEAGLGEPMRDPHCYAPSEAIDYPGGPAAVYEEAIRRGIPWEEVRGYEKPDYRHYTP